MAEYLRLRQICLVAPHLAPVISDISEIMGLNVCYRDGNVAKYGLENALLPVDTILLEVVAPFQPGTAAGRFLDKTGGRGGYMAIFCCDDPDARGKHANGIGVRTANVITHAPYHGVQLHPRDCRAAFIEFNHTDGSDDVLGPYPPAGPDWQKAIRKDVTLALTGVEMQSPDPQGLAEHWGKIIGHCRQQECKRRAGAETAQCQLPLRQGRERSDERVDVQGCRYREGARCGQGEGLQGVGRCVRSLRRDVQAGGVTVHRFVPVKGWTHKRESLSERGVCHASLIRARRARMGHLLSQGRRLRRDAAARVYRPLKFATRRSAVALTPSLKSSVARSLVCSASSWLVAASTRSARPARMVARVEIRPSGEHSAISCGELHRLGAHLVLRHAEIGEAHPGGFLAGDAAAGVENQFRVVLADQFGKRRGQAEAGMKAELGEVGGEARFGAGDAEIRRYRKAEPAADGGAMDGGDDRLLVAEDAHGLDVEMVDRQVGGRIALARSLPAPAASDR